MVCGHRLLLTAPTVRPWHLCQSPPWRISTSLITPPACASNPSASTMPLTAWKSCLGYLLPRWAEPNRCCCLPALLSHQIALVVCSWAKEAGVDFFAMLWTGSGSSLINWPRADEIDARITSHLEVRAVVPSFNPPSPILSTHNDHRRRHSQKSRAAATATATIHSCGRTGGAFDLLLAPASLPRSLLQQQGQLQRHQSALTRRRSAGKGRSQGVARLQLSRTRRVDRVRPHRLCRGRKLPGLSPSRQPSSHPRMDSMFSFFGRRAWLFCGRAP